MRARLPAPEVTEAGPAAQVAAEACSSCSWPRAYPVGSRHRQDNERGKGDHRHYGDREEAYAVSTVDQLVADLQADVTRLRSGE